MLNHITIMGRIVKDLELRRTQSGHAVCSFTLAVPRDFREQDGNKAVDWINCIAWRQGAEYICKYGKKGRMVVLEGRLQSREYTDRNGEKKKSWEVTANNIYFADAEYEERHLKDLERKKKKIEENYPHIRTAAYYDQQIRNIKHLQAKSRRGK